MNKKYFFVCLMLFACFHLNAALLPCATKEEQRSALLNRLKESTQTTEPQTTVSANTSFTFESTNSSLYQLDDTDAPTPAAQTTTASAARTATINNQPKIEKNMKLVAFAAAHTDTVLRTLKYKHYET